MKRLFVWLVVIAAAAASLFFLRRPFPESPSHGPPGEDRQMDPQASPASQLTPAALHSVISRANVAVAQLENLLFDEAEAAFVEIAEQLPAEKLGPRNLTICRLLAFESGSRSRAELDEALQILRQVDPDAAATHWLTARAAIVALEKAPAAEAQARELEAALAALRQAEDADPANAIYPFARYEVSRRSTDDAILQDGVDALREAYGQDPNNLYVASEWLSVQVAEQQPAIAETLHLFRQALAPVATQLELALRGRDPFQFLDQAIAAAAAGDWRTANRNTRIIAVNALRPLDIAKSDLRLMQPHDLEFVISRFSEPLYEQLAPPADSDSIEVQLVPVGEGWPLADAAYHTLRWVDFDLDGDLDLLALSDTNLDVYDAADLSNRELLTSTSVPSGSRGLLVADLDHDRNQAAASGGCFDADVDVIVYGTRGFRVYRNEWDEATGARSLVEVPQDSTAAGEAIETAILADIDHDSDLDLLLGTSGGLRLLSANGALEFFDVSEYSQLPPAGAAVTSMVAVDWDRDVDIDVVATLADGTTLGLLENLRHGNFRWRDLVGERSQLATCNAIAVADLDGNASWDVCGIGVSGTQLATTRTNPDGSVSFRSAQSLGAGPQSGLQFWDFDNNGYQDVLSWGRGGVVVRRGDSEQTLASTEQLFEHPPENVQLCEVGDMDGDGDQDLLVLGSERIVCYRNEGGNQNHWLQVRALGQVDNKGKVNHNGIGSLLEVATADRYQAQVVVRPVTHFGLGRHPRADSVRFLWTNGVPQAVVEPQADQAVCEQMILKGSCPYLYAWDGEQFGFVTDLLWAAPLGLQVSAGQLAASRPWEHLLVEGQQLKQRDGHYELRITEELWEAAYFDEVALMAVDHPADVSVFTNEKVGPAEIAEHRIHTVRTPRQPVAARDKHGRDVAESIAARDGTYFQGFQTRLLPGLVEPHYLELDLGRLTQPGKITLFLSGWIYPTDTSLNIAISQHPTWEAPRPPAVEVLDASGAWREVISYMGFPGGKTKTIAVDLSDAFLTNQYQLRIVTSNEIYWDQVFFTVDETPADVRVTPLHLATAELRYRGFSAALPQPPRTPERYDYARVSRIEKWPPMQGHFTRYGAVEELLRETDDRLVVLSSGDEVALRFEVPAAPLPAGWARDFVLYNVGWDKDADLNTVVGQSVEPLPFVGMAAYPYPDEEYPAGELQSEYLKNYQTRRTDRRGFWRGRGVAPWSLHSPSGRVGP